MSNIKIMMVFCHWWRPFLLMALGKYPAHQPQTPNFYPGFRSFSKIHDILSYLKMAINVSMGEPGGKKGKYFISRRQPWALKKGSVGNDRDFEFNIHCFLKEGSQSEAVITKPPYPWAIDLQLVWTRNDPKPFESHCLSSLQDSNCLFYLADSFLLFERILAVERPQAF